MIILRLLGFVVLLMILKYLQSEAGFLLGNFEYKWKKYMVIVPGLLFFFLRNLVSWVPRLDSSQDLILKNIWKNKEMDITSNSYGLL